MPALLTSTSRRPWRATMSATTASQPASEATSRCTYSAPSRRGALALLVEHVGEHDGGALRGEQPPLGRTLAPGPPPP